MVQTVKHKYRIRRSLTKLAALEVQEGLLRHFQCVSVGDYQFFGKNGACYIRLQINVGKGEEVMKQFTTADRIYHCVCAS